MGIEHQNQSVSPKSAAESSQSKGRQSDGGIGRRGFLQAASLAGAGLLLQPDSYEFDWSRDVPPSLMLHSGNVDFLPELLPELLVGFDPMTYRDWLAKIDRLDAYASLFARFLAAEKSRISRVLGRRQVAKLPLILSIDDVGTDWIRWEHSKMFDLLLEAGIPAVVGVQPKVMPERESRYWDRLVELHAAGWEIASHSINHPPLTQVNRGTATFEIVGSCDRIEQVIGQRPTTLITPFGDSNPPTDTSQGNKQMYELAIQAELRVIAGIQGGRSRLGPDQRKALRSVYPDGAIPEYAGRVEPDSRAEVTIDYLHNFN